MTSQLLISDHVEAWSASPFAAADGLPWRATQNAEALVRQAIAALSSDYAIADEVAVHRSATIESGAILEGPAVIGPRCFVAFGAYLRGGTYLGEDCIVGPGSELKTSFMFPGSKIAHLNFVGDSILGSGVNVEAGAMIANYRNELIDKAGHPHPRRRFRHRDRCRQIRRPGGRSCPDRRERRHCPWCLDPAWHEDRPASVDRPISALGGLFGFARSAPQSSHGPSRPGRVIICDFLINAASSRGIAPNALKVSRWGGST